MVGYAPSLPYSGLGPWNARAWNARARSSYASSEALQEPQEPR